MNFTAPVRMKSCICFIISTSKKVNSSCQEKKKLLLTLHIRRNSAGQAQVFRNLEVGLRELHGSEHRDEHRGRKVTAFLLTLGSRSMS